MATRTNVRCSIRERLDHIRMSSLEREAARAYLQQGTLVADAILQTLACLRSIAQRMERRVRMLLRLTH